MRAQWGPSFPGKFQKREATRLQNSRPKARRGPETLARVVNVPVANGPLGPLRPPWVLLGPVPLLPLGSWVVAASWVLCGSLGPLRPLGSSGSSATPWVLWVLSFSLRRRSSPQSRYFRPRDPYRTRIVGISEALRLCHQSSACCNRVPRTPVRVRRSHQRCVHAYRTEGHEL